MSKTYPYIKKLFWIVLIVIASFAGWNFVRAATNISGTYPNYFAWNDLITWMDFFSTGNVNVTSQQMTGYASSSAGDISVDCATTRSGNICSTSTYKVVNDGAGNLSGWAWNDSYGWVSFCGVTTGGTSNCPTTTVSYQVQIDSSGVFGGSGLSGWAWNDVAGWLSFNCVNPGTCGSSNYKVQTAWAATSTSATLDSTTYDTGVSGAQINSVLWHGSQPGTTQVRFQFATSNSSSGPWSFIGPDGTGNTYYTVNKDVSAALDYSIHGDKRYFRYRVTLVSNSAQTQTPQVDDVVVNWSP